MDRRRRSVLTGFLAGIGGGSLPRDGTATSNAIPQAARPSASDLPPWGVLDEAALADMKGSPVPKDWKPIDGVRQDSDESADLSRWGEWLEVLVDELAAILWPRFDPTTRMWQGKSASHIEALTQADFNLLKRLGDRLNMPISGSHPTTVTHKELFEAEDRDVPGMNYVVYDPLLPADLRVSLGELVANGISIKVASLPLQLKRIFQRPRAHQIALLQNRTDFRCELALSAFTPSLVSGHCLEGSLAGCHVYSEWRSRRDVSPASVDFLKQFTMDIGDRRVFAGVHYPSDNLASWYVAMRVVPHVFDTSSASLVTRFLWDAIQSKSVVYAAIIDYTSMNRNSPYRDMLAALQQLTRGM